MLTVVSHARVPGRCVFMCCCLAVTPGPRQQSHRDPDSYVSVFEMLQVYERLQQSGNTEIVRLKLSSYETLADNLRAYAACFHGSRWPC